MVPVIKVPTTLRWSATGPEARHHLTADRNLQQQQPNAPSSGALLFVAVWLSVWVCAPYVKVPAKATGRHGATGSRRTGHCEGPNVGDGDGIQLVWKNSQALNRWATSPEPNPSGFLFYFVMFVCFFFKVDHLWCFGIVCKHRTNTISPCVLFLVAYFPNETLLYLHQFASLWTWKMKGIIHINWDP